MSIETVSLTNSCQVTTVRQRTLSLPSLGRALDPKRMQRIRFEGNHKRTAANAKQESEGRQRSDKRTGFSIEFSYAHVWLFSSQEDASGDDDDDVVT